ncbi:YaiI/YqxD family protein [Pseudomonas aeruginosa]|nr:YaiI/YqxD family protein [Pseudomonas aeruginosa]
MRIWIDADACPKAAKELVCKFALKRKLEGWMVAGQPQVKPPFACVRLVVVESGMDAADDYLVEQAEPGDLAICSDVPLADRLIKKQVAALDPRGREFDARNMGDKLAMRNLMADLRDQGQMGGGQAPYGERDRQAFANALDRLLTRLQREADLRASQPHR